MYPSSLGGRWRAEAGRFSLLTSQKMKMQSTAAGDKTTSMPQHLHVDNPTPLKPAAQSPSPRHSSYALRKLAEEREKNKLLMQQLQRSTPVKNNDTYLNHIKELQR